MTITSWRRLIAGWQVIGGCAAAVTFLERATSIPSEGGARAAVAIALLTLCALNVLAGWALLRGHMPARARGLSIALWLAQVVGFRLGAVAYRFAIAPSVFLNVVPGQGLGVSAALQPHLIWHTRTAAQLNAWLVVNIAAVFAIAVLVLDARAGHAPAPSGSPGMEPAV